MRQRGALRGGAPPLMSAAFHRPEIDLALLPDQTDDSFIREVDEEYRRDQLAQAWSKYGRWLLIGLGLFLIALAGALWWHEEQKRRAGLLGEQYGQALEKLSAINIAGAQPLLDKVSKEGGPGYRTLVQLTRAATAARSNDLDKAAALYAAVAADSGAAKPFRDLAALQEIVLRYDTLTPAAAAEKLKPLALPGSPFFASAGELLAVAYLRQGKPEMAGPLFAQIAREPDAPPSLRGRASQMASMLGVNVFPAGTGAGMAR